MKIYKIPKHYDDSIARIVIRLLVFLILLHLATAIWILGDNDLFNSDLSIYSNDKIYQIVQDNGVPYVFITWINRAFSLNCICLTIVFFGMILGLILM